MCVCVCVCECVCVCLCVCNVYNVYTCVEAVLRTGKQVSPHNNK